MKRAKPRRTLIKSNQHYTLWKLDEELDPLTPIVADVDDEPSDAAIWTLLEHVPLRGPQLEVVLEMLSRVPSP
jgi:hypothetical protein